MPCEAEPGCGYLEMIESGPELIARTIRRTASFTVSPPDYGDSCDKEVPDGRYDELSIRLVRLFHGCGLGRHFDAPTTRAILLVRMTTLAQGFSGVSVELLESLENLLANDILPLVPQEGSVGASGDLTPLSTSLPL